MINNRKILKQAFDDLYEKYEKIITEKDAKIEELELERKKKCILTNFYDLQDKDKANILRKEQEEIKAKEDEINKLYEEAVDIVDFLMEKKSEYIEK